MAEGNTREYASSAKLYISQTFRARRVFERSSNRVADRSERASATTIINVVGVTTLR